MKALFDAGSKDCPTEFGVFADWKAVKAKKDHDDEEARKKALQARLEALMQDPACAVSDIFQVVNEIPGLNDKNKALDSFLKMKEEIGTAELDVGLLNFAKLYLMSDRVGMRFSMRATLPKAGFIHLEYVISALEELFRGCENSLDLDHLKFWKDLVKFSISILKDGLAKGAVAEAKSEVTELIQSADPLDEAWCQKFAGRADVQKAIEDDSCFASSQFIKLND